MSLLQMSFSGGCMVLAIALVRAVMLHRLPKKTFLALWAVALVRLLLPYSLPSALSVYTLAGRMAPAAEPAAISEMALASDIPRENLIAGTAASEAEQKPAAKAADPWKAVWAAGALACAAFFTAAYFRYRREFQAALPIDNDWAENWLRTHRLRRPIAIRQSDRISAPLTYGVFCPVLLMPKTTDWSDRETLEYVLEHEYVHIRRLDAVTKLLLTAALCVHWFNPTVWLMVALANRDIELSCDETVLRKLGEQNKSAYAMALIRMEETKSGFSPLYSSFSKNAVEERIEAIMKIKKISRMALFVAIGLVFGVTTAFATSEKPLEASVSAPSESTDIALRTGTDYAVSSYTDPRNGTTYYTWDGGKSWTAMTDEEFEDWLGSSGVDWWTAEEYEAWLEEEKEELRSIVGSRGWTGGTGWFTWDEEMVEETISQYEQTLEKIRSGMMLSKPDTDGDTAIMFGYELPDQVAADAAPFSGREEPSREELLSAYGTFGISFDEEGRMLYHDKPVRFFADFVEIEDEALAVRFIYRSEDGTEYIRTVRDRAYNDDGSFDPFGPLREIVPWEEGCLDEMGFLFQGGPVEATAVSSGGDPNGVTFAERFAEYEAFGISYEEAEGDGGIGNVYLNGRLVSRFSDVSPEGGAFSFSSAKPGGICVKTVYDLKGELIGIEQVPDEHRA